VTVSITAKGPIRVVSWFITKVQGCEFGIQGTGEGLQIRGLRVSV
jgi:hypothetical protein